MYSAIHIAVWLQNGEFVCNIGNISLLDHD